MNDNASRRGGPGSGDKAANTAAGVCDAIFTGLVQAEDDTVGLLGCCASLSKTSATWLSTFPSRSRAATRTDGELLAHHLGRARPAPWLS